MPNGLIWHYFLIGNNNNTCYYMTCVRVITLYEKTKVVFKKFDSEKLKIILKIEFEVEIIKI